jgi:hypothetical protein
MNDRFVDRGSRGADRTARQRRVVVPIFLAVEVALMRARSLP